MALTRAALCTRATMRTARPPSRVAHTASTPERGNFMGTLNSWLIETQGTLNLDNDTDDYGKFINSKIAITRKRRSYSFGIFYMPHNESGGINFSLNGFI